MNKKLLAGPYVFWAVMFILIPLGMVFYYGLTDKTGAFTLENVIAIATAEHSKALWESIVLSLISTIICFALAYPLAMILCRMEVNQHSFMVLIFILVDELSAAHTGLADPFGENRRDQQRAWLLPSAHLKYDQHTWGHHSGYGI